MIDLASLQHATFAGLVGETFTIHPEGVPLVLKSATLLGHRRADAARDPFSLLFAGQPGLRMDQGIRTLESASLGRLEIFLTQVGGGPQGSDFEAIFT